MTTGDAASFLKELTRKDIQLWLEGGDLRFRSPPGLLTSELRARIAANRASIIASLEASSGFVPRPAGASRECPDAVNDVRDPLKGVMDGGVREHIPAKRDELIPARSTPASRSVEILTASRNGEQPLSYNQRRLWFMKQMEPDSAVYHIPAVLRLRGTLDVSALEKALKAVIARQESLRTRFVVMDGSPHCVVEPNANIEITKADLSDVPAANRQQEAIARALETVHQPFDLSRCPLLRVQLLRLEAEDHILVCVTDHIVADGISIGVLMGEWLDHYSRYLSGEETPKPPLRYQYLDYADWQRGQFAAGAFEENLAYWREQLAGLPPALGLPTDRTRPPVQTYVGTHACIALSEEETGQLKELARREGATLFMVLMSAFQALLHRYTSEADIPVGTAVANRGHLEFKNVVGFFANTIVMRGDFRGNPSVREAIGRAREMALRAFAHEDMPFDMLVDAIAPRRSLKHSPLFQVMFVLQNMPAGDLRLPNLRVEQMELAPNTARFDLAVDAIERAGRLSLFFEYNIDLFDGETVKRMMQHYRAMLAGYVSNPDSPVASVALLSPEEQQLLTVNWNRTETPFDGARTMPKLFEAQVAKTPDAVAVRFDDTLLTYAELNARANQFARRLRSLGVGPSSLVALHIERSLDMLIALLSVQKAGGAYVPLDPSLPAERLYFMLSDSGATVLVTGGAAPAELAVPDGVYLMDLKAESVTSRGLDSSNLDAIAGQDDVAYVIYTSGSTGKPKGVAVSHGSLTNFLCSMKHEPGLDADDVVLAVTTISFDIAALELYLPLLVGARIELASRRVAADPTKLAQLVSVSNATVMQATPTAWRQLLEVGWRGRQGFRALCGGEALPPDLADALLEKVEELWNLYGPTETTVWSTVERVGREASAISIGRPIANTQVYILDSAGELVPIGVPGEIWIGGAGVAVGYHRRPELTAQRFVPDRFSGQPAARLYRTGDLGRWGGDGRLFHLGRLDDQVKLRGFRIELGEIESVLLQHPAVQSCAVVVRDDQTGDRRLIAYIIAPNKSAALIDELRGLLKAKLPQYMIPSAIVPMASFPHTSSGKLDRSALPLPDAGTLQSGRTSAAPKTRTEKELASIWSELLGVKDVGVHDNFFDLGGHSLLIIRLINEVRKALGFPLRVSEVLQNPTIDLLARLVNESHVKRGQPRVVRLQKGSQEVPLYIMGAGLDESSLANLIGQGEAVFGTEVPLPAAWIEAVSEGRTSDFPSLEQLIAPHLAALTAHVRSSPCVLAGHSFSGMIAVEVARQLQSQGGQVEAVLLFDTWARLPHLSDLVQYLSRKDWESTPNQTQSLQRFRAMYRYLRKSLLVSALVAWYATKEAHSTLRRLLGKSKPTVILDESGVPIEWEIIKRLYDNIMKTYQPPRTNLRGVLFRAGHENEVIDGILGEDNGWAGVFGGGLKIIPIAGNHLSMIRSSEHKKTLAEAVKEYLSEARPNAMTIATVGFFLT
jgi:amino acid adenylation domain-containing protein